VAESSRFEVEPRGTPPELADGGAATPAVEDRSSSANRTG